MPISGRVRNWRRLHFYQPRGDHRVQIQRKYFGGNGNGPFRRRGCRPIMESAPGERALSVEMGRGRRTRLGQSHEACIGDEGVATDTQRRSDRAGPCVEGGHAAAGHSPVQPAPSAPSSIRSRTRVAATKNSSPPSWVRSARSLTASRTRATATVCITVSRSAKSRRVPVSPNSALKKSAC